jgi:hypothetical protein
MGVMKIPVSLSWRKNQERRETEEVEGKAKSSTGPCPQGCEV